MSGKVELFGRLVRTDTGCVVESLDVDGARFSSLYGPRVGGLGFRVAHDELVERAAWALVAQWLVAYAVGAIEISGSLAEAERWFLGDLPGLPRIAPDCVLSLNGSGLRREEAFALLPYLLDPLAPGTRRAVMKDKAHAGARLARKRAGVYYTPADLAHYMVRAIGAPSSCTWLDPACGSGVFLRAALGDAAHNGRSAAFGCDIAPHAVEHCAYTLLAADVRGSRMAPWSLWHLHRLNLATVDSLGLLPGSERSEVERRRRAREVSDVRIRLLAGGVLGPSPDQDVSRHLGDLFPDLTSGADALVCNPPYARLGSDADLPGITASYDSFAEKPASSKTDASILFIEHCWRLTDAERGRAAVVVPLSCAFNGSQHFRTLRSAMMSRGARWRFAFFDRAPDALFGDDVKTRNTVILYEMAKATRIETTSILRWTSRNRSTLFSSFAHTDIAGADITELIPKLATASELRLFQTLRKGPRMFSEDMICVDTVLPGGHRDADAQIDESCVYVAPTAYNWLNCARSLVAWQGSDLSRAGVTRLRLRDRLVADAAYALLSSRLVFWLWRVEGDAFHVTRRFLRRLPFSLGSLQDSSLKELAGYGVELWRKVARHPVSSTNKGRRTIAFPPTREKRLSDAIDALLVGCFAFDELGDFDLRRWYEELVIVDRCDTKRMRLARPPKALPHA